MGGTDFGSGAVRLSFEEKLRNYARQGLMYGLGFDQKARPLYVESYQIEDHGGFLPVLAREAYALGAPYVDVRYRYPALERQQFLGSPDEHKLRVPDWVGARAKEIVAEDGARLALNGNGELGIMDDVSQYSAQFKSADFKANEPLTTRRMNMQQPWSILDVPTVAWAEKLGMSIADLWEFLFTVTGADRVDSAEYAIGVSEALHRRCEGLNALNIRTLHFLGDGTDLKVGLSSWARWIGGRKQAEDGTWFGPNWASFEVFSTPDWTKTEGFVRVTMPSVVSGPVVEGLSLYFAKGRIVDFSATRNKEAFRSLIEHDEGAAQLGEVALVGLDSPLSAYKNPHFCTLLDENKRCHIAIGRAYLAALEGGASASPEELPMLVKTLGCNMSDKHHDMMISDETTSVFAIDANGKRTQLMEKGHWLPKFA